MRLVQLPLGSVRTMTTKSTVVKASIPSTTTIKSSPSTYVSKAPFTGKTSAVNKAASTSVSRQYKKSEFSTSRSTPAASSSTSSYTPKPKISSSPTHRASDPFFEPYPQEASSVGSVDSEDLEYSDDSAPGGGHIGGDNSQQAFANNTSFMKDAIIGDNGIEDGQDWTRSFSGMAVEPFEREVADILMAPLDSDDIEIKPDGLLYLPEIKYRRILNRAFGPGAWGLAPRSEHSVSPKTISREYALVCRGRFVSSARGEQDYFDPSSLATASEGCKSNALMRCCKDLGVASELWDPAFIRKFRKEYCEEVYAEHLVTKRRKKLWKRKDNPDLPHMFIKAKF
ncbi:hypothetical protein BGZ83_008293 [Gryganskiella cystojenkinii]|nr:hypothetical protein BGZ83_008293 [Gryganskiella cystojenkinii]